MLVGRARSSWTTRSAWRYLGRGVTWGLFGLAALAVIAVIVVPAVTGAQRYTILGASMEPTIPVGSLVVVRPRSIDDVPVGSVVTFQLESGKPTVATHRVVGTGVEDGARLLVTKGDANATADLEPVREEQLRGVVTYSIPLLGWMNVMISGEMRMRFVPVAGGALLLYAAWMFVSAWRDRARRLPAEPAESSAQPQDSAVAS